MTVTTTGAGVSHVRGARPSCSQVGPHLRAMAVTSAAKPISRSRQRDRTCGRPGSAPRDDWLRSSRAGLISLPGGVRAARRLPDQPQDRLGGVGLRRVPRSKQRRERRARDGQEVARCLRARDQVSGALGQYDRATDLPKTGRDIGEDRPRTAAARSPRTRRLGGSGRRSGLKAADSTPEPPLRRLRRFRRDPTASCTST